jgi:hypothetical protein
LCVPLLFPDSRQRSHEDEVAIGLAVRRSNLRKINKPGNNPPHPGIAAKSRSVTKPPRRSYNNNVNPQNNAKAPTPSKEAASSVLSAYKRYMQGSSSTKKPRGDQAAPIFEDDRVEYTSPHGHRANAKNRFSLRRSNSMDARTPGAAHQFNSANVQNAYEYDDQIQPQQHEDNDVIEVLYQSQHGNYRTKRAEMTAVPYNDGDDERFE